MKVKEIMSRRVACCAPDASLQDVARMMIENDCGAIPVCEAGNKPIGVVTDRDITCRAVAQGKNPLELKARDVMTGECFTVAARDSVKDCCRQMEKHQVRRVLVVDDLGHLCGIVAQADVARHASKGRTAEVVQEVSEPEAVGV
jgi:CBS domain-containing protein